MGSPVRRNGIFYLVLQQLRGLCVLVAFCPPPPCTRWCFYKSLGFTEPQRVRPSPAELQAAALRAGTLRTHPAAHTAAFFLHLCNRDDKSTGRRGSGGPGGVSRRHTPIPQPWCQAAAGSAPAPWSRFVRRRRGR